jgi:biopolymer transport protein ExbD
VAAAGVPKATPVVLMADREIPYGTVIAILDALRAAGFQRFAFAVEPVK